MPKMGSIDLAALKKRVNAIDKILDKQNEKRTQNRPVAAILGMTKVCDHQNFR